jgi:lipopolysaccharide export system protein LptC
MTLSPLQFIAFAILTGVLIMLTMTWLAPTPTLTAIDWEANVPQWFAVNASSVNFDESGKPKNQVLAEKLTHFDKQKQTEIVAPEARMFNVDAPPWQLQADAGLAKHASALEDMREMDLLGNVIIWREEAPDAPISELTTEFLKFFPEEEYIETDALVNFRYGLHSTSALGMTADLKTEHIKLLNQVQSQYVNK